MIFGIFALFCLYFFRDPARVSPKEEGLIISPADGTLQCIVEDVELPSGLSLDEKKKWTRVSIFLSVFNVHIQRVPISGKITKLHYNKGLFLNANLDKASEENERQSCVVKTKDGHEVGFVQIAGLIARRIVCDLQEHQEVKTGEKYGIIRFGSRVDIYLPAGVKPKVLVGQTMIGGETIIADFREMKATHEVKKEVKRKEVKKSTKAAK
jgi:phosphatidylserine decarboxylase